MENLSSFQHSKNLRGGCVLRVADMPPAAAGSGRGRGRHAPKIIAGYKLAL